MSARRQGQGDEACTVERMPRLRQLILDVAAGARDMPHVHAVLQVEVTELRRRFAALKARGIEPPSMTAFIVHCLARAAESHPHVHAVRRGHQLFMFDEVDVSTVVERFNDSGQPVAATVVIRSANRLSLRETHAQLRAAQVAPLDGVSLGDDPLGRQLSALARLPRAVRALLRSYGRLRPAFRKRSIGTVSVSAVGMFSRPGVSGWAIPMGPWPLMITVGTFSRVMVPDEAGGAREAEHLNLTMTVDHAAIDGGPAARFAVDFGTLLEAGHGLEAFASGAEPGDG